MRLMTNFILLTILFASQAQAQSEVRVTLFPPELHSIQTMTTWAEGVAHAVNPGLQVKLLKTQDWADYINNHHFVPLTIEGVPEGYKFDFNFYATPTRNQTLAPATLPAAEVTEEGKFIMWDNICNFLKYEERKCKELITMVVKHENEHYRQWLQIATEAVRRLNRTETPKDLDELRQIPGAEEIFMRKWASGAHYQCREVEVYVAQMRSNEMPRGLALISTNFWDITRDASLPSSAPSSKLT